MTSSQIVEESKIRQDRIDKLTIRGIYEIQAVIRSNDLVYFNDKRYGCKHGYENNPDLELRLIDKREKSEIDAKIESGAKRMALALGINL